jgi:hypothetical protein
VNFIANYQINEFSRPTGFPVRVEDLGYRD